MIKLVIYASMICFGSWGLLSSVLPEISREILLGMIFPIGHLITPFSIMPLYMINPSYPYLIICLIGLCLSFYMIYNQKLFFKFKNA